MQSGTGQPQRRHASDPLEVGICGQHPQVVPDTQLGQQGVNRADLSTLATALISEIRSADVILAVGTTSASAENASVIRVLCLGPLNP